MKKVKVGLIGYGTVGQGVIRLLKKNAEEIEAKLGARLELAGVADADVSRPRKVKVAPSLLTSDPRKIINDPKIPIIIELVGDWPGVKELILDALKAGKSVVTANKALLAKDGDQLIKAAVAANQDLYYEASVCGTIPIIRVLREGLAANSIEAIYGIVNGTCNYILTGMTMGRGDYKDILAVAQAKGFAEAKPEADVEGYDPAHKLAILTRIGFGLPVKLNQIYREGITKVTQADIEAAAAFGYTIKLLAIAKRRPEGIEARVHPTLVPRDTTLAAVSGPFNAVYVVGNMSGPTLYYGRGAGSDPTASAVVGDVMELARRILRGDQPRRLPFGSFQDNRDPGLKIMSMGEVVTRYYIRMEIADRPGVLSKVSGVLGEQQISIRSVSQRNRERGPVAVIVIITHEAREALMQRALEELKRLSVIRGAIHMMRIESNL
jgi:homoserine dehydrogenase